MEWNGMGRNGQDRVMMHSREATHVSIPHRLLYYTIIYCRPIRPFLNEFPNRFCDTLNVSSNEVLSPGQRVSTPGDA